MEALIAEEHERITVELTELRARLKGVRGFVAAGAVHGHRLSAILGELGISWPGPPSGTTTNVLITTILRATASSTW